jgi:murein L,D-transpeptidase YcbB/YkuD
MAGKKQAGPSAKAVAGKAKKDEVEAKKQAVEDGKKAAAEDVEWSKGANNKKASRDDAAASKADETARKKREKEALQAAEEEELGQGGTKKATTGPKKKKGKPKSDLDMLEDALQKSGEKKFKKTKEDLLAKKAKAAETTSKEPVALDPLLANTQSMIGSLDGDDEGMGRNANKARMEADASGIDAALDTMKIKTPGGATSSKALYNEFEERMLPEVKDDYPGLRLTQYKEKVWNLWKKSADNPANQLPKDGAKAS